jgi:hypothetical protein
MRFERVSLVRARSADLIRAGGPGDRPGHMHAAGPASKHYQFPCIAEAIHTCRSRSGKRGSPSARHRRRIRRTRHCTHDGLEAGAGAIQLLAEVVSDAGS